jgi:threonyl-tRNA synthetase
MGCLSLVKIALDTLGLTDFRVRVGLRDPDSSKYVGDPANWDKAEAACREAAASLGVAFTEEPGEAAFYGPKIDFVVKDVIGREWQLGTVQVDYNLPERFGLEYIGSDNTPHRPGDDPPRAVRLDGAVRGRADRALRGRVPAVAGARAGAGAAGEREEQRLRPGAVRPLVARGVRATVDLHNDRVQAKIKHAAGLKIPYSAIVGPRDEEARRRRREERRPPRRRVTRASR